LKPGASAVEVELVAELPICVKVYCAGEAAPCRVKF